VTISLLQLFASTNVFSFVLSVLEESVMVHMGEDEKMSHRLYLAIYVCKCTKELLNGSITSLYCTGLK
jgi:hypothetical protein